MYARLMVEIQPSFSCPHPLATSYRQHEMASQRNWRQKDKINEGSIRRAEVLALYKYCECFVSLHLSEGFDPGTVESLMLNFAVITTVYSGNMHYADTDGVFLVDYDLIPLKEGEYFLSPGQLQAKPSISHTA